MRALRTGSPEAELAEGYGHRAADLSFLHAWTCSACGAQYDVYTESGDDLTRRGAIGQSDFVAKLHRELVLECASGHASVQFRTRGSVLYRTT